MKNCTTCYKCNVISVEWKCNRYCIIIPSICWYAAPALPLSLRKEFAVYSFLFLNQTSFYLDQVFAGENWSSKPEAISASNNRCQRIQRLAKNIFLEFLRNGHPGQQLSSGQYVGFLLGRMKASYLGQLSCSMPSAPCQSLTSETWSQDTK